MAKDPAFLFYSQDFYTGVATLNWEERGKFISILCLMHQQGRMSEETIRFLVGSVSVNLKSKFKIDENGLWYNERLESEAKKRNEYTESRRINGNLGGRPKNSKPNGKPKNNHMVKHMGNHMGNENEDVNEDIVKGAKIFGDSSDTNFFRIQDKTVNAPITLIYGVKGWSEFLQANMGVLQYPEHAPKFMKKYQAYQFFDSNHLHNTYMKFIEKQYA